MKNFKELIVPAIVLFVICLVATALLAVTNDVTAPKIEQLAIENEIESRKIVFPAAVSYGEAVTPEGCAEGNTVCEAYDADGNVIGYVAVTVEKGYGGDIVVMTGVDAEGKVTGVNILEISETAGLGMNAKNESYLNQYLGLSGEIFVSKDKPGENSIDALTGATITSRAVTDAVNMALELAGGEK